MKNLLNNISKLLVIAFAIGSLASCSKVPAGNVGIKVYLLGGDKGVDHEELGVGRYWIGINEELYLYPTFTQNYVWTKDTIEASPNNESITFQTSEGLSVNADVGISYRIDPTKVSDVFVKYRRGIDEITDVFLRNEVRDALVQAGSKKPVEFVYGVGKSDLVNEVDSIVTNSVKDIGIIVEKIYFVGDLRLPPNVVKALNDKIAATQRAQQRENELREAEAQAKKRVADAQGEANANQVLVNSITPTLIEWKKLELRQKELEKWNGAYPQTLVNGQGTGMLLNMK